MTTTLSVAPRPVFNVIDHAHRDLQVANDIVRGRFTVAGVTHDLGCPPDWRLDPHPSDKEWRVEWVKCSFGLDLAHAHVVTGDRRYLATWACLVESFIGQRKPGSDDPEVVARRVQNWIYAWNRFAQTADGSLDAALGAEVAAFLWDEVVYVRDHLTKERNHRTLELYALLTASLAFPERDPDYALRGMAFAALHANLSEDVRPDGVHREQSTHYHCIALRSWLGAMCHARAAGMEIPASYVERVTAACEFALHAHRPDGRIPACSDADGESYQDVLALAASLFDRPDWRWGATSGRSGAPPVRRGISFPDGGYHIQRSGWGDAGTAFEDEAFLIFDCGPLGAGGHGHYDLLSVELYGRGRPLLVDPGRYTYSESGDERGENWRRWFKSTAAHNTVTVDGLDQTPYARRKPKGPIATGSLLWRVRAPGLDVMCGEATSPQYEARHQRTVIFVANEYWIVVDDLIGQRPHHYELRWHLAPFDGQPETRDRPTRVEVPGAVLAFAPARGIRIESGWYAPTYGVKVAAPIVVVDAYAQSTTFVTVVDPRSASPERPPLAVGFLSRGNATGRAVLEVRGVGASGDARDLVTWAPTRDFIDLDRFCGVARAACLRRDLDGQPLRFVAADVASGSWRSAHSVEGVDVVQSGSWFTWSADRTTPFVGEDVA